MSDLEIVNPVPSEELAGWVTNLTTSFLNPSGPDELAQAARSWGRRLDPARTWGAREDGRWVATLATDPRHVTVPGPHGGTADLLADAVTGVTVGATHRRRGLLRTMIGRSLDAAVERGHAISVLIAAEWPIYGRYGYAPATAMSDLVYSTGRAGAAITPDERGRVRQVELAELIDLGPGVFAEARRSRAGQIDRPAFWWQRQGDDPPPDGRFITIVHETDGVADGTLAWRPEGAGFDMNGSRAAIDVPDFVAASATAYRNLWAYLAGLDLVDTVRLSHRPVDEPVRWLLGDGRALRSDYTGDFMWLKLLDVPAALSARGYANEDSLVLDVVDDSANGYAAGRYRLDAAASGGQCGRTRRRADLRIDVRVLASAYLGGYGLTPQLAAGRIEEHTRGAVRRLDALLATPLAPHCQTGF